MTVEEIICGESKNIEFKESLPKNSEKYTKTVIAFANTQGGKLVFGVADDTRKVVGIDEGILFQVMDSIANAVSDSCEPQIVPTIEPYTIEGKTVVLVTVLPEPHRPYFLKSKGREKGTYIRVGGTTRLAGMEKIKELEMEGEKVSWDELICVGYTVTDDAIDKLCNDMNAYRKKMQEFSVVSRINLENWKVLKKVGNEYLASNAFVLLTSDFFPFSRTQCAVFKGTDRTVFLDKREYTGPLYEQINGALKFVLRNIRLGAKIEGMQRKEAYELPVEAIREMIVNAHCHRNMRDESCVQIAIYDDRLEVTSPGGLYNGLTFEEAMQGHSKLRNRAVANIFRQIGLVESWGTGLHRIRNAAIKYGLPEPEFIEMPESFRVNLFRNPLLTDQIKDDRNIIECVREDIIDVGENVGEKITDVGDVGENVGEKITDVGDVGENVGEKITDVGENVGEKITDVGEKSKSDADMKEDVVRIIFENRRASASVIAKKMSVTQRTVERYIRELREEGRLLRHGPARGGYWEVK